MLNHIEVMKALQEQVTKLFVPLDDELTIARHAWYQLVSDQNLQIKLTNARTQLMVPRWTDTIDTTFPVVEAPSAYHVIGIDGSQIYPDRHYSASCALINTGIVSLHYGAQSRAHVASKPTVLIPAEIEQLPFTPDLINARRQEFELSAAESIESFGVKLNNDEETLFLFDGSLIFWHLQAYDETMCAYFLTRYNQLLMHLFEQKKACAWFISLPKSKELVNLVRLQLCNFNTDVCESFHAIDHLVDAHIASFFLPNNHRSIVFEHRSKIIAHYHEQVRPYFFYVHTENEIARVELPAWLAGDEKKVSRIAHMIFDQMHKGYGYPVSLAEAHEQAVVKGPDREFFYHLLAKCSNDAGHSLSISQKSAKKRRMNV